MKTYLVTFDFADYEFEVVRVMAKNRKEVREIMRRQYGKTRIHEIEELEG